MSNAFDLVDQALKEARMIQTAADKNATDLAGVLKGRLRRVTDRWMLCDLKRELRDFDMTTRRWK